MIALIVDYLIVAGLFWRARERLQALVALGGKERNRGQNKISQSGVRAKSNEMGLVRLTGLYWNKARLAQGEVIENILQVGF